MSNIYLNTVSLSPWATNSLQTPEAVLAITSTKSSVKSSLRRMAHEGRLLALQLNIVHDELALKTEQVRKTIARLEEEIQNRPLNGPEDRRLITIAKRLKMKLDQFIPRLAS